MEQHKFNTHAEYVGAQLKITRRRLRKSKQVHRPRELRCFTIDRVTAAIVNDYDDGPLDLCVCHGVRTGDELDLFSVAFGGRGRWVGTEITPEMCDGKQILCQDFSEPNADWLGRVDVMYSNSFDHARDPQTTARVWVDCLRPRTGRLYVEWTRWHDKLGQRGNVADCFAASVEEYADLFAAVGRVECVMTLRGFRAKNRKKSVRRFQRRIVVVSKGENR